MTTLEEKYELEKIPVGIGGRRLELWAVSNWSEFVDQLARQGDACLEHFPFWVKIWEASIVLANHLVGLGLPKEARILELGAGMGLVGLFLGACGHQVTITDYNDDAVALLRKNVVHNGLETVTVKRLDWNAPDLNERFDVVCGSELLYKGASLDPIVVLLRQCLQPGGTVYLAHAIQRKCLAQFISMLPGRFRVENIVKTMRGEDEINRIAIHALRLESPPPLKT